eukprot:8426007-Pyramimonas_sp.AAC.1
MHSPAHSLQKRVLTVYSEVVAYAARQGAPASSHATHRRSLKAHAETVTQEKVASPIRFMRGCSFPRVSGRKIMIFRGNECLRATREMALALRTWERGLCGRCRRS